MRIYWLNAAITIEPESEPEEKMLNAFCDTFRELLLTNVKFGDGFDGIDDDGVEFEKGRDE